MSWMTASEAADYVRCSLGTFERLIGEGVFPPPYVYSTRKRVWRREELDEAIIRGAGTKRPTTDADEALRRVQPEAAERRQARLHRQHTPGR